MSQRTILIEFLKDGWLSNFQMQQRLRSSSADRVARTIRENPPEGWEMVQRWKDVPEGYNKCLEYRLVPLDESRTKK